jgi:hypothetical protein
LLRRSTIGLDNRFTLFVFCQIISLPTQFSL